MHRPPGSMEPERQMNREDAALKRYLEKLINLHFFPFSQRKTEGQLKRE